MFSISTSISPFTYMKLRKSFFPKSIHQSGGGGDPRTPAPPPLIRRGGGVPAPPLPFLSKPPKGGGRFSASPFDQAKGSPPCDFQQVAGNQGVPPIFACSVNIPPARAFPQADPTRPPPPQS